MGQKREIDVKKQVRLSGKKTFEICLSGITHRMFRSVLTLSVILLAVAFFMFLLTENTYVNSTDKGVDQEIVVNRMATRWLSWYYERPSEYVFARRIANSANDPQLAALFTQAKGMDAEAYNKLVAQCQFEMRYIQFFDGLPAGKRISLVDASQGRRVFRYLRQEENWQRFLEALQPMIDLKLPSPNKKLEDFIIEYQNYRLAVRALHGKWVTLQKDLAAKTQAVTKGKDLNSWFYTATDADLQTLIAVHSEFGLSADLASFKTIQSQLKIVEDRKKITSLLNEPEARKTWKKDFKESPNIDTKMRQLADKRVVEILNNAYTIERLEEVSDAVKYENRLNDLEADLSVKTAGKEGALLSGRQIFLLSISFVVCMVGIANAMLMAITERFREIATMKCLGATDGFILTQFMMEAALQGIAGGLIGSVLGFIITVLKGSILYGGYFWAYFPVAGFVVSAVVAIAAGVLLAILASIYPSWSASRMAPMEAMRIE